MYEHKKSPKIIFNIILTFPLFFLLFCNFIIPELQGMRTNFVFK